MADTVAMGPNGLPLKDSGAVCDGCGTLGTVGRAYRALDGAMVDQCVFCSACWPEHSARLEARWKEQNRLATERWMRDDGPRPPSVTWGFDSASWHGTLQLIDRINQSLRAKAPTAAELATIANSIAANSDQKDGPMPLEVEMFVRKHAPAT
jgi:hypothetical protein